MNIFQKIANLFSKSPTTNGKTENGVVKFFNRTKGFGFIAYNNGNDEVFVHKSDVQGFLRKSDKVTFQVSKTKKGLAAVNVKRIK